VYSYEIKLILQIKPLSKSYPPLTKWRGFWTI
jgi:hypothetical protein